MLEKRVLESSKINKKAYYFA